MEKKPPKQNRLKRKRRRWFAVIAMLLGFLLATLLAEVSLRVYVAYRGWTPNCYVTGLAFFVPDEQTGHTLRPGLRLRSSTYSVTTNRLGLRGPEIELQKPADTLRIAVLGGSSVFGYLVDDDGDSCRVLESMYRDQYPDTAVEVINAGVPGFNMTQCRLRFESQIAELAPDFAILYLGWNDIPQLLSASPEQIDKTPDAAPWLERTLAHSVLYGLLRYRVFPSAAPQFAPPADASTSVTATGAEAFRTDLLALIEAVRQAGSRPILCTQLMAASQHCTDLDAFLGDTPEQIESNRLIGQWITDTIRAIAEQADGELIDASQELPCNAEMLGDAIHLTERGHRELAALWLSRLTEVTHP